MIELDHRNNPYAPGAGTPPPTMAGRERLLDSAGTALARVRLGRSAKSFVAVGLRGVGKTVLLNEVQSLAEAEKFYTVYIEAFDDIRLSTVLAKALDTVLVRLSKRTAATHYASRAINALRNFTSTFKISYQGFDVAVVPERGIADSGDLGSDLTDLFIAIGQAAKEGESGLAIIVDEMQYLSEPDLAALIMAIHRCNQKSLPVVLFGAGLPQLRGKMGNVRSYVERLIDFPDMDALSDADARRAIEEPANKEGVAFTTEALDEIVLVTSRYPYFLQEWGHFAWLAAPSSPITLQDVQACHGTALAKLDQSFFRVRLDRMTPTERRYVRALAQLGPGAHRSGDIAKVYGAAVTTVAPIRSALIAKGMIYSPAHGDTAFTVPLFDAFMRRELPWPVI